MNVERLLEIAKDVKADLTATGTVAKFGALVDALQQAVNQPQQPQPQGAFESAYANLLNSLETAPSNSFTASWTQTAREIGAEGLLGHQLAERVVTIITTNQITRQTALEELKQIRPRLVSLSEGVDGLINAIGKLGFVPADLEPGTGELSIVVPREFVDNELGRFAVELRTLDFIFGSLARLAAPDHRSFQIRAIGSSDLQIILTAGPAALWVFGHCVDKILAWVKEVLEIKQLWNDLKNREPAYPEGVIAGLEEHANMLVTERIAALREELLAEDKTDRSGAEKNELGNAVEKALRRLARRIDRGFQVEVRVQPLPPVEDDVGETEERKRMREVIALVEEVAPKLQYPTTHLDPILSLPDVGPGDDLSQDQ